jgi:hypothetical protein
MTPTGRERWWTAAVLLFAVLYMSVGLLHGLEWTDEGQILYPSWRVARGAIPYRDFHHLYGPLLFLFNGGLLRLFGPDIRVIRIALLVVKVVVVVLTYRTARVVAGRSIATAAALVVVSVWGAPGYFNVPYANHYAVAFILLGLAGYCAWPAHFLLACGFAGVCFGVAGLFKQTSGLFALLGLGLALLWDRADRATPRFPGGVVAARAVRALFLIATTALCVAYLRPSNTAWNILWLFGPAALAIILLFLREVDGAPAPQAGAWGVVAACTGAALPVVACLAYFSAHQALGDLYFDVVTELPTLMRFFLPLPAPPPSILLLFGLIAGAVLLGRRPLRRQTMRPLAWLAALLACGLAAAAGVVLGGALQQPNWHLEILWVVALGPFLAVWGTLPGLFPETLHWWGGGGARADATAPVALFHCVASMSLLNFYPYCDIFHVFMSLPLFLPLIALVVARGLAAAAMSSGRATAVTAGVTALLCAPFVYLTVQALSEPESAAVFSRASGVRGEAADFAATAELVGYLESLPPEQTLLVLANKQLLYFLSGRDSLLPRQEFLLYLVGYGSIRDADARTLLPEQAIIDRIAAAPPVIIDDGYGAAKPFRRVFPQAARFIDTHYRVARVIGRYRVLGWAG